MLLDLCVLHPHPLVFSDKTVHKAEGIVFTHLLKSIVGEEIFTLHSHSQHHNIMKVPVNFGPSRHLSESLDVELYERDVIIEVLIQHPIDPGGKYVSLSLRIE